MTSMSLVWRGFSKSRCVSRPVAQGLLRLVCLLHLAVPTPLLPTASARSGRPQRRQTSPSRPGAGPAFADFTGGKIVLELDHAAGESGGGAEETAESYVPRGGDDDKDGRGVGNRDHSRTRTTGRDDSRTTTTGRDVDGRPERLGADVERELLRRDQQRQETLLVAAKQPPLVDPRTNVRRFSGVGSEIQRTWSGDNSSSNTTETTPCTCTSNSSNGSNGSNSSCSCNATDAGGGGGTTTATEEEGMNLKTIIQSLLIIGGVLLGLLVLGCILLCLCRQPASDAQVTQQTTTYTGPVNVDEELYTDDEDVVDRTRRKKTEKKQKKEKKDAQKEIVAEAIL